MAPTYQSTVLAQRPKSSIVIGETFKTITNPKPTASDLKDGEVLLQSLYLSLDPAMRGWLNGTSPALPPPSPPPQLLLPHRNPLTASLST